MIVENGPIRLFRQSAVIITHKTWARGLTLENFIHKDRPKNVGCIHYIDIARLNLLALE